MQPAAATAGPTAGRYSPDGPGLVPNADLTHFYANAKFPRKVPDVGSKIDALLGGKVKKQFSAIYRVLDIDQLHLKLMVLQDLTRADKHRFLVRTAQIILPDLSFTSRFHKFDFL
jgi:hypothetical protein